MSPKMTSTQSYGITSYYSPHVQSLPFRRQLAVLYVVSNQGAEQLELQCVPVPGAVQLRPPTVRR
jgi:hypothetical protein